MEKCGKFIGVICSLKSEARAVARSVDRTNLRIGVCGFGPASAEKMTEMYCNAGAAAIVSVRIAGALDPAVKTGDLMIAEEIIGDDGKHYATDGYLVSSVRRAAEKRGAIFGSLFGSDVFIDSESRKAALFYNHNCLAADTESHGCARGALRKQTPLLAIRAIADPAHLAPIEMAIEAAASENIASTVGMLLKLAKKPQEAPQIIETRRTSDQALARLRSDLGPLFGGLFRSIDL